MINFLFNGLFGRHDDQDTPFFILPIGQEFSHQTFLKRAAQLTNVLLAFTQPHNSLGEIKWNVASNLPMAIRSGPIL